MKRETSNASCRAQNTFGLPGSRARHYHGVSMTGLLLEGDRLVVDHVCFSEVRRGDVILFRADDDPKCEIVHRVHAVTTQGLHTRGDKSNGIDKSLVTEARLIGRLAGYERDRKYRKVAHGDCGHLRAQLQRTFWQYKQKLYPFLYPLYLTGGHVLIRICDWQPRLHRIRVSVSSGEIVKYIHGQRTIARWDLRTGHWSCLKPYDLILQKPAS
jgi:hypothetical protein